jgi:hypothetical protein
MKTLADYDPNLVASVSSRLDQPTTPADQILDHVYDHFYQIYSQNLPITMPTDLLDQFRPHCADDDTFHDTIEITAHLAYKDLHTQPSDEIIKQNIPSSTDYHKTVITAYGIIAALIFAASNALIGTIFILVLLIGFYYLSERIWLPRGTVGDSTIRAIGVFAFVMLGVMLVNMLI